VEDWSFFPGPAGTLGRVSLTWGEKRGPRQRPQVAPIQGDEAAPAQPCRSHCGLPVAETPCRGRVLQTPFGVPTQPAQDPDPDGAICVLSPTALQTHPNRDVLSLLTLTGMPVVSSMLCDMHSHLQRAREPPRRALGLGHS